MFMYPEVVVSPKYSRRLKQWPPMSWAWVVVVKVRAVLAEVLKLQVLSPLVGKSWRVRFVLL